METRFFALSDWPSGLSPADRYHVSVTQKPSHPVILDAAFIGSPREVWEEREDPETEEKHSELVGWEANVSTVDCAIPASIEAVFSLFGILHDDQPEETMDPEEIGAAYERALPPPVPPVPHEPRKFSVKAVAAKIRELGYTAQVREALMGVDGYEMYVGANYLKEDDRDFQDMKALVMQVTGLAEDAIEAILKDCIWEA